MTEKISIENLNHGVLVFFLLALNSNSKAETKTELEKDQDLLEQDFSLQIDGRYMSDTYFTHRSGSEPRINLNESFVSLSAAYQERIRLVLIANFGHLIDANNISFNDDFDVETFIRDAYIEIRNINNMPIAIIIGKHPITFGQNIQEMPGWANSPLRRLQEIREVYGLTVTLTKGLLGLFDQIDYSLFEQDRGDLKLGKLNGHNLRFTKYLNEQVLMTIGLQQRENTDESKMRQARVGFVGMNKSGKLIGWAEGMIFSNDPDYPNSNFALTMGASYQFAKNSKVVMEFNLIEKELIQLGLGVKTSVNNSLSAGVDVRVGQNLQSGELEYFIGVNVSYSFNIGTDDDRGQELLLFEDELSGDSDELSTLDLIED